MSGFLSVREAAEELDVHYMTVYKWIRTGRLPAVQHGREWRIDPEDLAAHQAGANPRRSPDPVDAVDHAARLRSRLLAGDEGGVWTLVEDALAGGMEPDELQLDVLTAAMREIGEAWARGEVSVHEEHRATAVLQRVLGRLGPRSSRAGRSKGVVLLGAVAGDHHGLPSALLVNPLRRRGYTVVDLGADTPSWAFADAAGSSSDLRAVGVVAVTGDHDTVRETITAVRDVAHDVRIVLGGAAVADEATAHDLGADGWAADGAGAVALLAGEAPALAAV